MNGLITPEHINFFLVFFEGVLSFFSPCVIPLLPIYVSYLAGNAKQVGPDGQITYKRGKVFLHTFSFVLGISFAFFILGFSFSALGNFFNEHKTIFSRVGGILIVLLGLMQVGFFGAKFLQREHKFHLKWDLKKMNPLLAFLMGFTFSFAWTPCVGPALSSVLILASGAKNALVGNLLVFVYALGFVIPFLILGLFTAQVLNFFRRRQRFLQYTIKVGGVLLIFIGIMTFTGWMNGITGYLSSFGGPAAGGKPSTSQSSDGGESSSQPEESSKPEEEPSQAQEYLEAFDFTLKDQNGVTHTLSDYKGKVIFLNFWTTWCPHCIKEMPDIEALYKEYGLNKEDVVILGVANPKTPAYPSAQDESEEVVRQFIEEQGITYPILFDYSGEVYQDYQIYSFPTTFMIRADGKILGYVPGGMSKDMMKQIIEQTKESN